jgi:hypothetical protein
MGHEPSPRLDDCEGPTAVVRLGEVGKMSAIGTEEMIDWTWRVGFLG